MVVTCIFLVQFVIYVQIKKINIKNEKAIFVRYDKGSTAQYVYFQERRVIKKKNKVYKVHQ